MMSSSRQKITDQEIMAAFDECEAPAMTAKEISDELDVTRHAISYRLDKLAQNGAVNCKSVGSRAVIWWPIED